ncbi:MAG: DMT family transporter [Rhodobacteraceae bacterium]|nr:DMT family transporter [Paracoccaceae bacterium]
MTRPTSAATLVDVSLWFALAAAWSSSYAVIKIGVAGMDPTVLVAGRMTIAAIVILGLFKLLGGRLSRDPLDWLSYGITGMLGSVLPFLLITYGEQNVDSALTAILMGFAPVGTVILAATFLPDERLTLPLVLGIIGALIGISLLVGPAALLGMGQQIGGQAAILGATLCYASSTVYIRRFVKRPPLEMAAGSSLIGTLAIVGLVYLGGGDMLSLMNTSSTSLAAVIYLGLVSTAAANLTYFFLVPRLGANRMSQVNFAVPVGGTLIGAGLLGETVDTPQLAALVLITGSVWLATRAGGKMKRQ